VPLGVHPWSYDVWRYRPLFVTGVSAGAPPDSFFTRGQTWASPPLNPDAIRRDHYRYPIACLRHQVAHADRLRIDHIMGLHRLFWVPSGFDPSSGVYVRYRADEWYAVLSVESHLHRAELVGENLGTVPRYVNAALARHGIRAMYVLQFEARPDRVRPLPRVRRGAAASLNTHDVVPFAAFLRGLDIDSRHKAGLISTRQAAREHRRLERVVRALEQLGGRVPRGDQVPPAYRRGTGTPEVRVPAVPDPRRLLERCLMWLADSPAGLLLVNLEDLWLETAPQNMPGTGSQPPNWRRRTRYSFERFTAMAAVRTLLGRISERRGWSY
jgi:4-alpha-glucanotransferase